MKRVSTMEFETRFFVNCLKKQAHFSVFGGWNPCFSWKNIWKLILVFVSDCFWNLIYTVICVSEQFAGNLYPMFYYIFVKSMSAVWFENSADVIRVIVQCFGNLFVWCDRSIICRNIFFNLWIKAVIFVIFKLQNIQNDTI